jgi:hypothetical protein
MQHSLKNYVFLLISPPVSSTQSVRLTTTACPSFVCCSIVTDPADYINPVHIQSQPDSQIYLLFAAFGYNKENHNRVWFHPPLNIIFNQRRFNFEHISNGVYTILLPKKKKSSV